MRLLKSGLLYCLVLLIGACVTVPKSVKTTSDSSIIWQTAEQRYQDGDLQAAAELYREAVALQPQMTWGYLRLGVIAYRRGEQANAEKYFAEVLEREPTNQKALFDMSLLRLQQARDLVDRYLSVTNRQAPRYAEARALAEQFRAIGIAD